MKYLANVALKIVTFIAAFRTKEKIDLITVKIEIWNFPNWEQIAL